eukprot:TRINITY_DN465_c0_g1_i2.p1 TRINITY_DN465_c0_g1~~TRINITY_DN465_c0_g1_i2.p1  ORF type:complete len:129 (+),score=16.42 TRINITY_DN465_c0_g1_i2:502-888(+)
MKRQVREIISQSLLEAKILGPRGAKSKLGHMVFLGNPGTGKTTIARIIAKILHRAGVLRSDKLVEVQRPGLIGSFVGGTEKQTKAIIEAARGGVLFVDEAYQLCEGSAGRADQHRTLARRRSTCSWLQ